MAVASQLNCKNTTAIEKDINTLIGSIGLCKENPAAKGIIEDLMCETISGQFIEQLVKNNTPKAWECGSGPVTADLRKVVIEACKKIL